MNSECKVTKKVNFTEPIKLLGENRGETDEKSGNYDKQLYEKVLTFFQERRFQDRLNDVDEMRKQIYVGNGDFAQDLKKLKLEHITHVLNLAVDMVETSSDYYKALKVKFHSIDAEDNPEFDLKQFFQETSDIIENAIRENGKILIHCAAGYRRAPTIFIAYLMIKQKYHLWDAVVEVRAKRKIFPNKGFIKQLCVLEQELLEQTIETSEDQDESDEEPVSDDFDQQLYKKVLKFFREKQFQNRINDVDLMFPNICVGNGEFAKDLEKLKLERITQVLNLAVDTVETNIDYYKALKIKFYGIDAEDDPDFDLKQFFQETSDIIEKAIHENGKILIHCSVGYSRAPTIFIAYLMMKRKYHLWDAVVETRSKRNIFPNMGFLRQLCMLEKELFG